jgi:hypothetical protein
MLRLSPTAFSQTLRVSSFHVGRPFVHCRAQSTLVDGERYWEGTPWKDVPVEEFNSYRWQVSTFQPNFSSAQQVSMLICVACKYCREPTQAVQVSFPSVAGEAWAVNERFATKHTHERELYRRCDSRHQTSPDGDPTNPAHLIACGLEQPTGRSNS